MEPELIEDTRLDQVTLCLKMVEAENENVIENVIENPEIKLKKLMPGYSKKKLVKAEEILKMISDDPQISFDDLRLALNVSDRTIARYISELKENKIIDRVGPDKGGSWKILL